MRIIQTATLFSLITAVGCSPAIAYQGPRPEEKRLVSAYFSSMGNIAITEMRFNDTAVGTFDWGIETTPGTHTYFYTADYDNLDEAESNRIFDYTPRHRCSGTFTAEPGKTYQIRVVFGASHVWEETSFWSYGQRVGGGGCKASL